MISRCNPTHTGDDGLALKSLVWLGMHGRSDPPLQVRASYLPFRDLVFGSIRDIDNLRNSMDSRITGCSHHRWYHGTGNLKAYCCSDIAGVNLYQSPSLASIASEGYITTRSSCPLVAFKNRRNQNPWYRSTTRKNATTYERVGHDLGMRRAANGSSSGRMTL